MNKKPYYYDDHLGRSYITLIRGSSRWINSDCPNIYRTEDGMEILRTTGTYGWRIRTPVIDEIRKLRQFVERSSEHLLEKFDSDLLPEIVEEIKRW